MEYQRSDRVGDLLLEVISELLRKEIRDPRISAVTLTSAKVSKDLRGQEDRNVVLAGLKSAAGYMRSQIGKQLKLRFVPTIEFFYDETEDEAQRIDDLLRQVKKS